MAFYEPPREEERPGCRDVWLLTMATFAILLPVVGALIGVMIAVGLTVVLYTVHPALALIPIAIVVGAVFAFASWEQRRSRPPGL